VPPGRGSIGPQIKRPIPAQAGALFPSQLNGKMLPLLSTTGYNNMLLITGPPFMPNKEVGYFFIF